jgi:hypothetical protein
VCNTFSYHSPNPIEPIDIKIILFSGRNRCQLKHSLYTTRIQQLSFSSQIRDLEIREINCWAKNEFLENIGIEF